MVDKNWYAECTRSGSTSYTLPLLCFTSIQPLYMQKLITWTAQNNLTQQQQQSLLFMTYQFIGSAVLVVLFHIIIVLLTGKNRNSMCQPMSGSTSLIYQRHPILFFFFLNVSFTSCRSLQEEVSKQQKFIMYFNNITSSVWYYCLVGSNVYIYIYIYTQYI